MSFSELIVLSHQASPEEFFRQVLVYLVGFFEAKGGILYIFNGATFSLNSELPINLHAQKAITTKTIFSDEKELWFPLYQGDKTLGVIGIEVPKNLSLGCISKNNPLLNNINEILILLMLKIQTLRKEPPKDFFIANMSHELRNPLNGLLGYLQILDNSSLSNQQKIYLHLAQKCGLSLIRIVNDILDYSKLMSGKMKVKMQIVNLYEVLNFVGETLHSAIQERKHSYTLQIDANVPKMISTDPQKITQICINLLSNAIKFTPPQGKITLIVSVRKTEDGKNHDLLQFRVSDTGPGINKSQVHELFRIFTRLHNTSEEGSGLGLVISKKLTELLNGSIRLVKSSSEGTEFAFEVPLIPVQEIRSSQIGFGKKEILLLVSPTLEKELSPHFLRWGLKTYFAKEIQEVYSLLESYLYDFEAAILEDVDSNIQDKIWKICPKFPIIYTGKERKTNYFFSAKDFSPVEVYNLLSRAFEESGYLKKKNSLKLNLRKSLLIAEDDANGREILKNMLQSFGFTEIEVVEDGLQTLNALQKKDFSYLLIDLKMPIIDGYEIITFLKKKEKEKIPKLICVSASVAESDRTFCEQMNVPFLSKPVQVRQLQELLASLE